jgi:hypothetical protein
MGNCNSDESRDKGESAGQFAEGGGMIKLNVQRAPRDPVVENSPSETQAKRVEKLPDLSPEVSEILRQLGPIDEKLEEAKKKSQELIVLGPFEYPPEENHPDSTGVYRGQYNKGKREGFGKMVWTDGAYYEGMWKDDKAQGFGRLVLASKDYYEGEWKNNKADGLGKYCHADGATYTGLWKEDKQDGPGGKETWPDGSEFVGDYVNSKKTGKGHFKWADKSEYQGDLLDNNLEGFGEYRWSNGQVYSGEWRNNQMHGKGKFTWPDRRVYYGQFVNDKKHGQGKFTWPGPDPEKPERTYEGSWVDGRQEGRGYFTDPTQTRRLGVWRNGVVTWEDEKKTQK